MPRPITVRLIGSLGNELFGYYAGAALADKLGTPLRLDTSWTRRTVASTPGSPEPESYRAAA